MTTTPIRRCRKRDQEGAARTRFKLRHGVTPEENMRRLRAYCRRIERTPAHRRWAARIRLRTRNALRGRLHGAALASGAARG